MIASSLNLLEVLFGWLLAASWQASVLALFVLVIQRLLGARLNPRWRYALWLLVLLRLVLPALPESALSLFQFAPPPPAALEVDVTEPLFTSAAPPPLALNVAPNVSTPLPAHPFSIYSILAVLWLIGAMSLLILTWLVNRRFARQVAQSPAISDPEILRLFAETKTELGIKRSIRLIESTQVQSPAIMGLFSPTLLLPGDVREKFDARELRFIFLHELAHLKRGDVIVQALIALLQILHWFNPVLWYAFRRMRIDREPATDALVLSRAGEDEKERYGLMLIKLLEHFNQRHSLPTLVGILEDKDQFKRRFGLIARFTRGAYGWSLLGVLLIAALAVAGLTRSKVENSPKIADLDTNKLTKVPADPNAAPKSDLGTQTPAAAPQASLAALVNGRPIYWADLATSPDFQVQYARAKESGKPTDPQTVRFLQAVLFEAVERELIVQDGDASGYVVPQSRLDEKVDFAVKGFGGDENAFAENLKKNGLSLEQFIEFNRRSEVHGHMFNLNVDEPTQKYIHDHPATVAAGATPKQITEAQNALYQTESTKLMNDYSDRLRAKANIQTFDLATDAATPNASAPQLTFLMLGKPVPLSDASSAKIIHEMAYSFTTCNQSSGPYPSPITDPNENDSPAQIEATGSFLHVLYPSGESITTSVGPLQVRDLYMGLAANQSKLKGHGGWGCLVTTDQHVYFFAGGPEKITDDDLLSNPDILAQLTKAGIAKTIADDKGTKTTNTSVPVPLVLSAPSVPSANPIVAITLQQAIDWDRDDLAKSLLDSGTKATSADFISALKATRAKIVVLFWNHGLHGCSPLSFAISQGVSPQGVESLLHFGAKVEPDEDTELSPLCVASAFGNFPAARVLLAHGANPNWQGASHDEMSSPLWLAVGRRQPEIVQILLDHGAVPQGPDVSVALGDLSAEIKARASADDNQKASNCFNILVDHGALEKIPASMKASELWNACLQVQDMDVVKTLLAHGLRPTDADSFGTTALSRVRDAVDGKNNWPPSPQLQPILDLLEATARNPPESTPHTGQAYVRLLVAAIKDDDYQAHRAEVDAAVRNGDPAALARLGIMKVRGQPAVYSTFGKVAVIAIGVPETRPPNMPDCMLNFKYTASPTATGISLNGTVDMDNIQGSTQISPTIVRPYIVDHKAYVSTDLASGQTKALMSLDAPGGSPTTDTLSGPYIFSSDDQKTNHLERLFFFVTGFNGSPSETPSTAATSAPLTTPPAPAGQALAKLTGFVTPDPAQPISADLGGAATSLSYKLAPMAALVNSGTNNGNYTGGTVVHAANANEPPQIQIELKVSEIDEDVYLANKEKVDTAIDQADLSVFNNLEGVSLLSAPSVTTKPGLKANIDIVREFPYPSSFSPAKVFQGLTGTGPSGGTNLAAYVPATPRGFATKDVGVSAEILPTISGDKIDVSCTLRITDFDGFIQTNQALKSPAFEIREANFLEEFASGTEIKGAMVPGGRLGEKTVTDRDDQGKIISQKTVPVKKLLVVFLSARLISPDDGSTITTAAVTPSPATAAPAAAH